MTDSSWPVAVVGLACRFPDADDPPALLDTVLTGRRAFRRVPGEHAGAEAGQASAGQASAGQASAGQASAGRAALIEGWQFDRVAFRIPERAYLAAGPAHWLALETAARALAGAGFPGGTGLDRDRIGVVIGTGAGCGPARGGTGAPRWPQVRRVLRHAAGQAAQAGGCPPPSVPAGISSYFGFRGGSQALDGACGSSLQAIAAACAALAAGDIDVALAGGVDLCPAGSPDSGEMRIYDASPAGRLQGEGCGVVVLMRAAQARAAGLPVYAEIAGWGASAGGRPGIVASDASSQLLALRRAYERAGADPAEVSLFEGQGSGTAAADDAELIALSELRAGARRPAALGSITANIGHAGAAAGPAGLIKAVLAVATGVIPPACGITSPHPLLRGADAAFWLPPTAQEWPDRTRLAGVTAAGDGSSVHLVLRSAAPRAPRHDRVLRALPRPAGPSPAAGADLPPACSPAAGTPAPFLLHAADQRQLAAALARLAGIAGWLSDAELTDLSCQLIRDARQPGPVRAGLVAAGQDELAARAREAIGLLPGLCDGRLAARPGIFAAENPDGRVTLLLSGGPLPDGRDGTDPADQARATVRHVLAALRWLDQMEVTATAAAGHDAGEIAGLAWAGVLSQADVAEVAALRAGLLASPAVRLLPAGTAADRDGPPDGETLARLRDAVAGFRLGPPRRRLISAVAGRELAVASDVIELICAGPAEGDGLARAVAAAAQGATLLLETGPGGLLASAAARACQVPAVAMDAGDVAGAGRATAGAALFAAGAAGLVLPLLDGRPSRPLDLWRDQVFITGLARAAAGAGHPGLPAAPRGTAGSERAAPGAHQRRSAAHAAPRGSHGGWPEPATGGRAGSTPAVPGSGTGDVAGAGGAGPELVTGAGSWERCFVREPGPVARRTGTEAGQQWRTYVAAGYPFRREAGLAFGDDPAADGVLAVIGDPAAPGAVLAAVEAAQAALAAGRLAVVTTGPGVTGLLASLHAEHPALGITVLRVPGGAGGPGLARPYAVARPGEFRELVVAADGTARDLVTVPRDAPGNGDFPLGPCDVALVSRSSGAAALVLAQVLACCGAAVAVIGQPGPGEGAGVVAGLEELRLAGARIAYEVVNAGDPAGMALAVRRVERRLGPVTAVAHAAGAALAAGVAGLTAPAVAAHLSAERAALHHLLRPVTTSRLRLVLTFGSVAACYGLPRQGLLALGAAALASDAEAAAAQVPGCRALHIDLPGWSDTALDSQPGLAGSMAEAGTAGIGSDAAARLLLKVLATPQLPARVAVHGRVGIPGPGGTGLASWRFLQEVVVDYPGIELVCDARLSLATDPYLADYRVDGVAVLPPVLALEAMAQAASALAGRPLRDVAAVRVEAPVVLPAAGRGCHIRVCALADGDVIRTTLRSAESGLLVDHVRAEFRRDQPAGGAGGPEGRSLAAGLPGGAASGGGADGGDLYGTVLFQAGRFRRIAVLPELTSRSGRALARGTDDRPWFAGGDAGGGGGGLLLGSPGLNDAALQVLQASTPDRRVWPAGCAGVRFSGVAASGPVEIRAAARDVRRALPVPAQGRGPLVGQTGAAAPGTGGVSGQSWDVEAVDAAGRVLVTWRGVTLREAGLLPRDPAWPAALLPAYLERGAIRLGLDPDLRITASGGSGLVLEAGGAPFAACGWVPADPAHPVWPGPGQAAAFSQLCGQLSEPPVASAARLRAAACLAGPEAAGLAFGRAAADGWALLEAGRLRVATTVVQVEGLPWPIAIAVTTDRAGRERRLPGGSRVAGPPVSVV